ncbi:MAG: leucine--tRNA ligase [Myxococcota bacterium]
MDERYVPQNIEPRWQKAWTEQGAFTAGKQPGKPKFYVLEMFPYPSGSLHMGNLRCYVMGDVIARHLRQKGHDVLHPMGFDALGLPAENAALKDGVPPPERTPKNIANARRQMDRMGLSYEWDREVATYRPDYYRWNQWFFLRMWERGVVYRRQSSVNWCPSCNTVLANEQVEDGKCWRCGSTVVTREIPEWAFRITNYAEDLLQGLNELTWPERILGAQRNWIGKSVGAEVEFAYAGTDEDPNARGQALRVFTTRVDTIYGATYAVIAAEHPLVAQQFGKGKREGEVAAFVQKMRATDKTERTAEGAPKEGVFTGHYVKNPFTGERIPLWIANFVLAEYGTGAVMSVPGHDQRDFDFAKKYGLPIKIVIHPAGRSDGEAYVAALHKEGKAFTEDGVLANSKDMTGKGSAEAREQLAERAQAGDFGKKTVKYHLRDWGFSRQRYWGTPIPVIYCEKDGPVAVPDDQLPVTLPPWEKITMKMTGTAPLRTVPEFMNVKCPRCGGPAQRDGETMDTFVDSAWYYARFLSAKNDKVAVERKEADRWLPIDLYIGGPEHAVGHLLYFRFWNRVMKEMGLVGVAEPAKRLLTQGIVYKDGAKMSKSKGNTVDPDTLVDTYGADTARVFLMFAGPPEKDLEWSDKGVEGASRFLARVYRVGAMHAERIKGAATPSSMAGLTGADEMVRRAAHRTLKKVGEDLSGGASGIDYQFNTAIAALMELTNTLYEAGAAEAQPKVSDGVLKEALTLTSQMLAPVAPHLAEEMWNALGGKGLVALADWPKFDADAVAAQSITYAVQVSGKLRGEVQVAVDAGEDAVKAAAQAEPNVQRHLEGKSIKKVVFVKGRLINFVAV